MREVHIEGKVIGPQGDVFVIAEAGVNHNANPDLARELILRAAEAGADAIKFQTYSAEKLVTKTAPKYYVDTMEQWRSKQEPTGYQYDEFSIVDKLPRASYRDMVGLCRRSGIVFMSTPFDEESADFLEELGTPAFKIASGDITCHSFLAYVARKKRPILLSTGCSTLGEIEEALGVIREAGNDDVVLLHCTLSYPSEISDANLNMMRTMQAVFPDIPVGLSDHTLGTLVPVIAASHGARVIEKHYTIDKSLPYSTDHFMSVDPKELKEMIENIKLSVSAMGSYRKRPIASECLARRYARRSIVAAKNISEGIEITRDLVVFKRPGTGIEPKYLEFILSRHIAQNIAEDTVITWDMIR